MLRIVGPGDRPHLKVDHKLRAPAARRLDLLPLIVSRSCGFVRSRRRARLTGAAARSAKPGRCAERSQDEAGATPPGDLAGSPWGRCRRGPGASLLTLIPGACVPST